MEGIHTRNREDDIDKLDHLRRAFDLKKTKNKPYYAFGSQDNFITIYQTKVMQIIDHGAGSSLEFNPYYLLNESAILQALSQYEEEKASQKRQDLQKEYDDQYIKAYQKTMQSIGQLRTVSSSDVSQLTHIRALQTFFRDFPLPSDEDARIALFRIYLITISHRINDLTDKQRMLLYRVFSLEGQSETLDKRFFISKKKSKR